MTPQPTVDEPKQGEAKACDCIARADEMLAKRNTRIVIPIMLGTDQTTRPLIETEQIEKGRGKQKACAMFASFCPFCGVSLKRGEGL